MIDQIDPDLFRHPHEDRMNMVQYNCTMIGNLLDSHNNHEEYIVRLIQWCKWWAGLRERRP